jgi:hypothetical protein
VMNNEQSTGEGALLVETKPERVRGDLRLIRRAIRERWPTTQESMAKIYGRVESVALNNPDDEIAINAARLITVMHGQNQKDEPQQVEHHHTHELEPITAENVDAKRIELHQQLNRLREHARGSASGG